MDILELAIRTLLGAIDRIVGWIIEMSYGLLMRLADVRVFNDAIIKTVGTRVSVVLGIFMLFKVSFSLITYAVSPDKMTDANKGVGKLITNIMLVLVMLAGINFVFDQAYNLQGMILRSNVIPQIIFGSSGAKMKLGDKFQDDRTAKELTFYVFSPFMEPNKDALGNTCDFIYLHPDTPVKIESENRETKASEVNQKCKEIIASKLNNNTLTNKIMEAAVKHDGVLLLSQDIITAKSSGKFLFNYQFLISTVTGVVVLLVLINFCFDVAVRSVKLSFLQLISPIPIISYIDPNSNKMFKTWTKECGSTFISLFIRLIALFFAIFLIKAIANYQMISSMTGGKLTFWSDPFVKVFMILGALLFAKEMPKLIETITGVKMEGAFNMNPLNKLGNVPLVGGLAAASLGYAKNQAAIGGLTAWDKMRGKSNAEIEEKFEQRQLAAKAEWKGRASASSLMGTDKYKGDTFGKILSKERGKLRTTSNEGRMEFEAINRKWQKGDEILEMLESERDPNNPDKKLNFKSFDGTNAKAYELAYKSSEFRASLMKLDREDDLGKQYTKAIESLKANPALQVKVDVKDADGNITTQEFTGSNFEDLYDLYDKQSKSVKGLEAVHETMRKKYSLDAATQDAIKFRKYNSDNPAGKSRRHISGSSS